MGAGVGVVGRVTGAPCLVLCPSLFFPLSLAGQLHPPAHIPHHNMHTPSPSSTHIHSRVVAAYSSVCGANQTRHALFTFPDGGGRGGGAGRRCAVSEQRQQEGGKECGGGGGGGGRGGVQRRRGVVSRCPQRRAYSLFTGVRGHGRRVLTGGPACQPPPSGWPSPGAHARGS
jgi:hypothetical protein